MNERAVPDLVAGLRRVTDETDKETRRQLMEDIAIQIEEHGCAGVDCRQAVQLLDKLLDDKDDVIVAWSAAVLGRLGAPAREALPHLRARLKDYERDFSDLSPGAAIQVAIQRLE